MIEVRKVIREENQTPINEPVEDNQIRTLLCSYENKANIIGIYSDNTSTDKFSAGYVIAVSSDDVVIAHITPNGMYDGFMLKKIEDIYRIDVDGKYETVLQKLYTEQSQFHKEFNAEYNNLTKSFLYFAAINKYVVTIELFDSGLEDVQGFIDNINEETVNIRKLNSYGEYEGNSIIFINDITFITCDSDNEHTLKILANK